MAAQHKAMTWGGWILSGLLGLLLTFSGIMKLSGIEDIAKEFDRLGYAKEAALAIGIVELACVAIYLFPQTSILGAILLTGYLGGATATHVRIHDPFAGPIVIGVLVWLGVFLREPRLRALVPWRRNEL